MTKAEELARVLGRSLFLPFEDRLTVAQAILASPVIARIEREAEMRAIEKERARKRFPILGGQGAKIDWHLVADHGNQARRNHSQTVERLAERGGLSWCELHAVLHNRAWQKMDQNEAMLACRSLEARYLAAIEAREHKEKAGG